MCLALGLALASKTECSEAGAADDEVQLMQKQHQKQKPVRHGGWARPTKADPEPRAPTMMQTGRQSPLLCQDAEPQAPKNVTPGFVGDRPTRFTPLDGNIPNQFIQVNLHWHLGAEHYSLGEYDITPGGPTARDAEIQSVIPAQPQPSTTQPGFFCDVKGFEDKLNAFNFQHCVDAFVGYTYEFHWVYSSGGPLSDTFQLWPGLGQVFNRTITPAIVVRGQACRVINDESLTAAEIEADYQNFIQQWRQPPLGQGVRYVGSTTGSSVNNEVCSPVTVHGWHVDTKCCTILAQTMDRTCQEMIALGLADDVKPKGSRELVAKEWSSIVQYPLAVSPPATR